MDSCGAWPAFGKKTLASKKAHHYNTEGSVGLSGCLAQQARQAQQARSVSNGGGAFGGGAPLGEGFSYVQGMSQRPVYSPGGTPFYQTGQQPQQQTRQPFNIGMGF
mgnify:CR=1 FL=1